jgi:hypothetical protein
MFHECRFKSEKTFGRRAPKPLEELGKSLRPQRVSLFEIRIDIDGTVGAAVNFVDLHRMLLSILRRMDALCAA